MMGESKLYNNNEAPYIEVPESVAVEMVIGSYVGEICIFCGKPVTRQEMDAAKWAPWEKGRVCHGPEWNLKRYRELKREQTK